MYGFGHFPSISSFGAPPHIGPLSACRLFVPFPGNTGAVRVGIIVIAILILLAIGIIF